MFHAHGFNMIRNFLLISLVIGLWSTQTYADPPYVGPSSFYPQFYSSSRARDQDDKNYEYGRELSEYDQNDRYDNLGSYNRQPSHFDHKIDLIYKYYALGQDHRGMHGGRIIVVPKRNNIPITYTSYDMLLEYLRIRNLANANQHLIKNRANIGFGLRDYQLYEKETQPLRSYYKVYEDAQE